MAKLFDNNPDGANHQARAVLAYLSARSGIEESWSPERKCYTAEPEVARWHNCREQGYIISLREGGHQINIAFFEHRNSDEICAIEWEQRTLNPPNIDSMDHKAAGYHRSSDVSHRVGPGEPAAMADWIFERLTRFWKSVAPNKQAA